MSGTQQSQIASLQSHTITNSQASTAINSTTNTPSLTQTNSINNQTPRKITLWEKRCSDGNLSLIVKLWLFSLILCIGLISIYAIIFGIIRMNLFGFVMGVCALFYILWFIYDTFIKKSVDP